MTATTAINPELLAYAINPPLLMERLGMVPDPWQRDLLNSKHKRILVLSTRQAGKSQTCATMGLQIVLTRPGALVVLVSEALRQSRELFDKLADGYRALGRPVPCLRETTTELKLKNGARVVCLPGSADTIVGFSKAHTIICDEAARMSDDLFTAVSPMLSVSGGRLVLITTPRGQRGYFFGQWDGNPGEWQRFSVPADLCPRISREHLETERRTMGRAQFMQEYFVVFTQAEDQYFDTPAINRAFTDEPNPYFDAPL